MKNIRQMYFAQYVFLFAMFEEMGIERSNIWQNNENTPGACLMFSRPSFTFFRCSSSKATSNRNLVEDPSKRISQFQLKRGCYMGLGVIHDQLGRNFSQFFEIRRNCSDTVKNYSFKWSFVVRNNTYLAAYF